MQPWKLLYHHGTKTVTIANHFTLVAGHSPKDKSFVCNYCVQDETDSMKCSTGQINLRVRYLDKPMFSIYDDTK